MKSLGTRLLSAALVLSLGAAASVAWAAPDFQWNGTMAAGKRLSIYGISGSVVVSRASGREASVTAVKTGKSVHYDEVQVEVSPGPDGVTICAIYPQRHGKPMTCVPGQGLKGDADDVDVDVDFTVKLPDGVQIELDQVNGEIKATDLRSDVEAATVNGSIRVSTTGLVEATSVNGSIVASLGQGTWERSLKFSTVNGSVRLSFPHEVNAEFHAETVNGSISSDFPVTQDAGFWNSGEVDGRIGKGGGRLNVSTVNGSIVLARADAKL